MSAFIRCPECGFCIGMFARFFQAAQKALINEKVFAKDAPYSDYDPDKMFFKPEIVPPMEPVFDALKIKNMCCRMHLLTNVQYDKQYT